MKHRIPQNNMNSIVFKLPEYGLVVLVILAGYTPPFTINPLSLGVSAIIILQIIYKSRITGILLGLIYFLANLYFLTALTSEFNEFSAFDRNAFQLLAIGIPIWIINALLSISMIIKYSGQVSVFKAHPNSKE